MSSLPGRGSTHAIEFPFIQIHPLKSILFDYKLIFMSAFLFRLFYFKLLVYTRQSIQKIDNFIILSFTTSKQPVSIPFISMDSSIKFEQHNKRKA